MKKLFQIIENRFKWIVAFFVVLIVSAFFDKILAVALIVLALLLLITYLVLNKLKIGGKELFWLCLIVLIIHLLAIIFIYYFEFQPFSGGAGGYKNVHLIASELSDNFRSGNFSFENISFYQNGKHPYRFYSVIIGVIYTFSMPEMLVGMIFQVWLSVITAIAIYLICKEVSGSNKLAFLIGLIASVYPSHLFYDNLLLKDGLVTFLVLLGLLFIIKLIKRFSFLNLLVVYLTLIAIFNFRFYIAYALSIVLIFSVLFLIKLGLKRKIIYTFILIIAIGIIPHLIHGHGFFGINLFQKSFTSENITFYQEEAYTSSAPRRIQEEENAPVGYTSTWERETVSFRYEPIKFTQEYSKGFSYILLGPFPWQLKKPAHYFALLETIPWYILLVFIALGGYWSIKKREKMALPLFLLPLIILGVITIFISNYGIVTRIRIPAFISLLCLIPFIKTKSQALTKYYG